MRVSRGTKNKPGINTTNSKFFIKKEKRKKISKKQHSSNKGGMVSEQ